MEDEVSHSVLERSFLPSIADQAIYTGCRGR